MNAILQNPTTGATVLTDTVTEANFSRVVYRCSSSTASIVEEEGVYIEIDVLPGGEQSRKVLFAVKAAG